MEHSETPDDQPAEQYLVQTQPYEIPRAKELFLASYSKWANIGAACKNAKISRTTLYWWRKKDQQFDEAVKKARETAIDALEKEVWRRASIGRKEPVYYKGEICGYVRKPSDLLAIFTLKAERPDKYRERVELGGNGPNGEIVTAIKVHLVPPGQAPQLPAAEEEES